MAKRTPRQNRQSVAKRLERVLPATVGGKETAIKVSEVRRAINALKR